MHGCAGPLGSVPDMMSNSNASSINVSWTAPFSLDVTGVDPDIWYSVFIYNVTDGNNLTAIPCTDCNDIAETHYIFTLEYFSPCHKFNFTVIPQNGVGDGPSSSVVGYIYRGSLVFDHPNHNIMFSYCLSSH